MLQNVNILTELRGVCVFLGAEAASFSFVNSCRFTVWVGVQPNGGLPLLGDGGFQLLAGANHAITAPHAWGGRFWGRTGAYIHPR